MHTSDPLDIGASLTPDSLEHVTLNQAEIDAIARAVPGGCDNILDIYPLSSSQEGLLFERLLGSEGDAYVLSSLFELSRRDDIAAFENALQTLIDRHEALRSCVLWKGLSKAVQVVHREAAVPVVELTLDGELDPVEQLKGRMQARQVWDVQQAPLCRMQVARGGTDRCYVIVQFHHLACDDRAWRVALTELITCLEGRARELPPSASYRRHVEWLQAQSQDSGKQFFQQALRGVEEPTTQFGVAGDRSVQQGFAEHIEVFDSHLTQRVRDQSSRLRLSPARFFHAAWALVVARAAGTEDVVFGTVLSTAQRADDAQQMLGMRINTLPLRVRLHELDAMQLLRQVDESLRALVEHRSYPLVLAQRCTDLGPAVPLFSAIINYRHRAPDDLLERTQRRGVTMIAQRGAQLSYPMTISVDDRRERGFTVVSQAAIPLDPKRVIAYLMRALQVLMEAIESDSSAPAVSFDVLPERERRQVIDDFNATAADYPRHQPVHELFEQHVKQTPSAVALVWNGRVMTYEELNGRANRLARALRAAGMQMGEYVPILMPRNPQSLIAQLAILKCGGVYVPMDSELPCERREFIIKNCAARRVLTQSGEPVPPGVELHVVEQDEQDSASGPYPADLRLPISSASGAYVMYTSGSTGVPKGVVVPHSAITRLVINNGYLELTREDCLVHHSNPSFDASTFEVWGALLSGARLIVLPAHFTLDMPAFARLVREQRVSVLFMSVGLLNQYIENVPGMFRELRCVFTGGDVVAPALATRVLREGPPQRLVNAYGPTECTTFSTTFHIDSLDETATNVPIGRPIANARIYILNKSLQPVPVGVTGELYIAGAGLASGYLNLPVQTAQRFVPDPYGGQGSRMYRTGDLGRWREDGAIEFLGRVDFQVKIRGFRIELGEIEARLAQHELVRDAVVVAREDLGVQKRLVAYVTAKGALSDVPATAAVELRDHLANTLPEYMVPSAIVFLEHLPLTSNGKIDRRALPAPATLMAENRDYTPPANATEAMLAGMWAELLQLDRVGREDHFFELGGHSLVATQVITRIRASFDAEVPIKALFDHPTLAQFSKQVDHARRARLLGKVEANDGNAAALLEEVASMSESEVRELLNELVAEERT